LVQIDVYHFKFIVSPAQQYILILSPAATIFIGLILIVKEFADFQHTYSWRNTL